MTKHNDDKHSTECHDDTETSDDSESKQQITWSNTLELVVSLIGYSTGMSDFWRFPYLVWRNGGGAFLFAYATTLTACGVPLYFLEVFLGQYSGKGVFEIWGCSPLFKGDICVDK
ncbi:sodium- and chloride-dependent glycine transporter 1-like [Pecten maximus]|uniref:sodium- and chloride-dependent glycine transporter 1-like n=1 Tax=Pecten maximus TaxID=6579 RepID=UPI001458B5A4|nr:sodium- and chloride-dependent glycine transporter 1-like [Pecten maximus]